MQGAQVQSLGQEDPLKKEIAAHSNMLGWRIPRTEEPDGLQSMGIARVGHDLVTTPPPLQDMELKGALKTVKIITV